MYNMKVGLQLYSIRDAMEQDMDKALGETKAMGYDYVEFAGYFGKSAEEVAALLKKHDLKCISVHQNYEQFLADEQAVADYLKIIGAPYCAIPGMSVDNHKGHKGCEKAYKEIEGMGKLMKKNGIELLYHNHAFEFEKFEGKNLLDWLFESFDEDLLKTEIDVCWANCGGEEPAAYIRKYSGRAPLVHLKDFVCTKADRPVYELVSENGSAAYWEKLGYEPRPVGDGVQDLKAILDAASEAGTEYLIVEDECAAEDAMRSVKKSRDNLKKLGL